MLDAELKAALVTPGQKLGDRGRSARIPEQHHSLN